MGVVRTGWGAALSAVCLAGLGAAALWFSGPPPAQPANVKPHRPKRWKPLWNN